MKHNFKSINWLTNYLFILAATLSVGCAETITSPNDGTTNPLESLNTPSPKSLEELCLEAPANVHCDFHISAIEWDSPTVIREVLTIPRGKVLASSFVTNDDSSKGGSLQYSEVSGISTERANVWISLTPGGPSIGDRCKKDAASFVYSLRYNQWEGKYCDLELSTRYFINMEHVDQNARNSIIERFVN